MILCESIYFLIETQSVSYIRKLFYETSEATLMEFFLFQQTLCYLLITLL